MKEEMKKAKVNLHKVIVDEVLSYGGDYAENIELYKYIIDLAVAEITFICLEKGGH